MIDFSAESYRNILEAMLQLVPNSFDKRDGSFMQTALGPAAYALEQFYLALNQVQNAGFIQTAAGQSLDQLGIIAGLTRYPASPAVRLGVFNVPVPTGARFSTVSGESSINFIVTAQTDKPNQAQLTAETAGTIGNDYAGMILPITYVEGLTTAELTDILIPGDNEETDEDFRKRIISALNERPFGGNIASYREAIMAIDGVGGVQIYPTWNGGGTVKCSVLGADFMPASSALVNSVQEAIDPVPGEGMGTAPIGADVTIASPQKRPANIAATVTLAAGYTIDQVKPEIQNAIENYLLEVRKGWDTPVSQTEVIYSANVYLSRVVAAIISVQGVVNATGVTINGNSSDLVLIETGTRQQVPVIGTVTLNAA